MGGPEGSGGSLRVPEGPRGSGKEVSLDYQSLLPAAPVLSMLAVPFTYGFKI